MYKIKLNDVVLVTKGKDAGKTGKIIAVNRKTSRVLVEGVNLVKKALKPTQENPTGGHITKELSLHLSNVSLYSEKSKRASRSVIVTSNTGKKQRQLKACGTNL